MNKQELKEIMAIANSKESLENVDYRVLYGCALSDFKSVHCTKKQVAALFRWQALMFNGEWDSKELDDCCYIARKKFTIVDDVGVEIRDERHGETITIPADISEEDLDYVLENIKAKFYK